MKKLLSLTVVITLAILTLAPLAWAGDVQGTIKSVDQTGRMLTLDDGTQLMIPAGLNVPKKDLQPGADVKASYEENGGLKVITSLEVRPAAK